MSLVRNANRSSKAWTPGSLSASRYVCGCPLRVRNSRTRSVEAECLDPTSTMSPCPVAISSARRRMNARIKMSLNSASTWTIRRSASSVISSSSPASATRMLTTCELPFAEGRDRQLSTVHRLEDCELAGDDDKAGGRHRALFDDDLSAIDSAPPADCLKPRNLRCGQSRKHLCRDIPGSAQILHRSRVRVSHDARACPREDLILFGS